MKIIRQIIGKSFGKSYFYIIRDNDGGKEQDILISFEKQIRNFFSKKNFNQIPELTKVSNNHYAIKKGIHEINLIIKFIPFSLEYQICQPYLKKTGLSLDKGENYHQLLEKIAQEKNKGILDIISESYAILKSEQWCSQLRQLLQSQVLEIL
jgi:hypothetical protein